MDIANIRNYVKAQLCEQRFLHTLRVVDTAQQLAERYDSSLNDVTVAALLHDVAKDLSENELKVLIQQYDLPKDLLQYDVELWHGPVGAKIAEHHFNIRNQKILDAIYYHTTGKANMGIVELLVFVSDYIEPARQFPGVNIVRNIAHENIQLAAREALKRTIVFLISKDVTIHPQTLLAYNDLTKKLGVIED